MNTNATLTRQALTRRRLILLVLGMICLLFFGLVYGYSMFVKSMMTDFGLTEVGPIFYVMMICFCLGNLISSLLLNRIEPRVLLAFAAIFYAVDFCCTGLLTSQFGIIVLYVCYAVIGGFASGAGYTAIVGTVTLWFPEKTGIASGLLLLGFGISSLLLGNAILALRSVIGSIGPIFTVVGILGAVFGLMLSCFIARPPQNVVQLMCSNEKDRNQKTAEGQLKGTTSSEKMLDPSARFENDNVLKAPIFWTFFAAMLLVSIMGLGVIGSVAADGMSLGLGEGFASFLVGLAAACNGLSRIVLGTLMDKKGVPFAFTTCEVIGVVGMLCIVCAFIFTLPILYTVGVLLVSVCYGGNPVMNSTFMRLRFGAKHYPTNLAISNFNLFFGAMINIAITLIFGTDARFTFCLIGTGAIIGAFIISLVMQSMWKHDFAQPPKTAQTLQEAND